MKRFIRLVILLLFLVMITGCGSTPNPFAGKWSGISDSYENLNLEIAATGIITGTITKGTLPEIKTTSITGNVNSIGGIFLTYQFEGESKVELTGLVIKQEQGLLLDCSSLKALLARVE